MYLFLSCIFFGVDVGSSDVVDAFSLWNARILHITYFYAAHLPLKRHEGMRIVFYYYHYYFRVMGLNRFEKKIRTTL